MRGAVLALVALAAALPAAAAPPIARAAFSRRQLMLPEEVRYTITVTADRIPRNTTAPQPDFGEFEVLDGPMVSTSQQVSMVNGVVTQSVGRTYSWRLVPKKEGQLSVPAVAVDVGDGRTVSAPRVALDVIGGQGLISPSGGAPQGAAPGTTPTRPPDRPRARAESSRPWDPGSRQPRLQIVATASDQDVWLGQELTLSHVLRYDVDVSTYSLRSPPDFPGFANAPQEIERPEGHAVRDTATGAILYHEAVLARWALVPLSAGTKEIPAQGYVVTIEDDPFRSIFGGGFGGGMQRQVAVSTEPISIRVKALPEGAPPGFAGAVGSFRLDGEIDATSVKAGDGVTLTLTVAGAGSLQSVAPPAVSVPDGMKLFDAESTEKAGLDANARTQGSKVFRYPILVSEAGRHEIPPIEWSFFDPRTSRYVTRTVGPFAVDAAPGDPTQVVAPTTTAQATSAVGPIATDIEHPPASLRPWRPGLGSTRLPSWIWLALGAPPALNALVFLAGLATRLRSSDPGARRAQGAARRAQARLKEAKAAVAAGRGVQAADAVARAVAGLVSDRLQLGVELAPSEAARALADAGAPVLAAETAALLDDCDVVRFASGAAAEEARRLVERATRLVGQLASARLARQDVA